MTDKENDNKPITAFAVTYDDELGQKPLITAKGKGKLAEKILDIAFDNNVKVRQDSDLVEILDSVDVGEEIPLKALGPVTEILEYVYMLNERYKK